jgi:RNA polymerase sigma-70 factor (ECF subfamily)
MENNMRIENEDMELSKVLWEKYEPSLRRLCNYKLSSYPDEIDDVIGETYLALCNSINKGTEIQNPKAWLYGILNNQIKLKYSEIDRKKKTYIRLESVEHELFYNVSFDEETLSEDIIENLKDDIFDELIDAERTLLILIYDKKIKLKDVARILNTTEAAVKQKHYRLKRKIKKLAKEKLKKYE